jgi:hypothetical protein
LLLVRYVVSLYFIKLNLKISSVRPILALAQE